MKRKKVIRKNKDIEYYPTFTDSTNNTRTLNVKLCHDPYCYWRQKMKKFLSDVFLSGSIFFAVNTTYSLILESFKLRDIDLLNCLIIGYLTVKLFNFLRS